MGEMTSQGRRRRLQTSIPQRGRVVVGAYDVSLAQEGAFGPSETLGGALSIVNYGLGKEAHHESINRRPH